MTSFLEIIFFLFTNICLGLPYKAGQIAKEISQTKDQTHHQKDGQTVNQGPVRNAAFLGLEGLVELIQAVKLGLNPMGHLSQSLVIQTLNIGDVNRIPKGHIDPLTSKQTLNLERSDIGGWHHLNLGCLGDDRYSPLDIVGMAAAGWKHDQRAVALFQHLDGILDGCGSWIFTVNGKGTAFANPPAKAPVLKELLLGHKNELFGRCGIAQKNRIPEGSVG